MGNKYDDSSIQVLNDIEHIRLRSSMYISTENPSFQMFDEIFSNALDEVINGYSNYIDINIDYDNDIVEITDHGRGLPQGENSDTGKTTIEVIYGKLNAGGKYDRESYAVSGGLNGVGSCVVNALSEYLIVYTWRADYSVNVKFEKGALESISWHDEKGLPSKLGSKSGTKVTFRLDTDHKLFVEDRLKDHKKIIEDKIKLVKTLLPDIKIIYNGTYPESRGFDTFVPPTKEYLLDRPLVYTSKTLDLAINWGLDNNRLEDLSYCNFIYNKNGGDHVRGVHDAISEYFNDNDALLGIKIALSVFYPDVEYDSQSKIRAVSKDLRQFTKSKTLDFIKKYFKDNPKDKDAVLSMIRSKRAAIDKRNNKGNVIRNRKSSFLSSLGVDGFSDCTTTNRSEAELYICEGLSAAGSLKQARDVKTQAVLPLRGKVINAYTSDVAQLLKNKEVVSLVSNIDTGIFDDVNTRKSRYGKIIICTDADDDGKDIAVQLLALFMRMMPELIEEGFIYLASPPLYGTTIKGKFIPIHDEDTKDKYLSKGCYVQRYKGLGEMNPDQLYAAVMDGATRRLVNVTMSEGCPKVVGELAGGNSKYRRDLLEDMGVLV